MGATRSVELTANPASGWNFAGWSGDLNGSTNPATISMTGNKAVTIQAASASVAIEDKIGLTPSTVVLDCTFSGAVDLAFIAIEIKP